MKALQGMVSVAEILAYIDTDRYLTLADAVNYLSLSERTLRGLLPEIKHYRIGRRILFRKSELNRWMQQRQETSTDLDQLAERALKGVLGVAK